MDPRMPMCSRCVHEYWHHDEFFSDQVCGARDPVQSTRIARARGTPCGPEGHLFEERPRPAAFRPARDTWWRRLLKRWRLT